MSVHRLAPMASRSEGVSVLESMSCPGNANHLLQAKPLQDRVPCTAVPRYRTATSDDALQARFSQSSQGPLDLQKLKQSSLKLPNTLEKSYVKLGHTPRTPKGLLGNNSQGREDPFR